MALTKSKRFEIFARDGFTCQYCGRRPPDVVLECDHIHPRSKGGDDDDINLLTACWDCNRGKRAKVVTDVAPKPDADMAMLAVQQEMVEAKRFLKAKSERDKVHKKLCDTLQQVWSQFLTEESVPKDTVVIQWILRYGAQEIESAIISASGAYRSGRFGFDQRTFGKVLPYVGAILRNRALDRESGVIN